MTVGVCLATSALVGLRANTSPRVLLLDAALASTDIVTVGERGTVLRSADSGKTWDPVAAPTRATLTGIAFDASGRTGWIVGHDATILASTDAGHSWQKQWQGSNLELSFLDVCALDAAHAIAVGAYGLFMATHDGGKTWESRKILDEDMHLNRITRSADTGTLFIAGEHGTLLRSADSGATWQRIDSPYDGSFYGILPLGEGALLAHGLRGRVFRSTDNGEAWLPIAIDRPMLLATAVKTRSGAIVLAGQARALYVSHDNGLTFTAWTAGLETAVAELLEAPDGTLLAFGEAGVTRLPALTARLGMQSEP